MVRDVYLQIWAIQNNIGYSQRDVLNIQYAEVHYKKAKCLNGPPKVPAGPTLPGAACVSSTGGWGPPVWLLGTG